MQVLIQQPNTPSRLVQRLQKFVASKYMLPIFAFVVLFCHMFALDAIGFTLLAAYMILVSLSKTHIRAILPAFFMLIMVISLQNGVVIENGEMHLDYIFNMLWYLITLGVMVIVSLVIGIYRRGLRFRFSWGFLGILFMALSFILGGLFMQDYPALNIAGGFIMAAMFIGLYIFAGFVMPKVKMEYLAWVVVYTSLVVVLQIIRVYVIRDIFGSLISNTGINWIKNDITLGWGITNSVAPMMAIGAPFAAYLALKHKSPIYMCLIIGVQTLGVLMTFSRGVIIFSVPFALITLVYLIIRTKKWQRLHVIIGSLILILISIILFYLIWDRIVEMLQNMSEGTGRDSLFRDAIDAFLRNPIFGEGIAYRFQNHDLTVPLYLVHNTPLQFLMWGGIFGLLAFAAHTVFLFLTGLYKPTETRLILLSAIALIYLHSMLDIMFFFPHLTLIYMLFMAKMDSDAHKHGSKFAEIKIFNKTKIIHQPYG